MCRWENNITMGLQEVGDRSWTGLLWHRVGTGGGILTKRGNKPSGSMKCGEILY